MSKKPVIGLAPNGNVIRSAGSDMDKSWSGHSTFRPLRNAEEDEDPDAEEGGDDMEKKALADVWFPKRTPLEHTWFDKAAEEESEQASGAPSAEGLFYNNPMHYETRQFAESEANTNHQEVAKEHAEETGASTSDEMGKTKKAPPTPSDIRSEAGGEEFSTLNRLVVDTEHETEKKMPNEGWHGSPKMDEVSTKQASLLDVWGIIGEDK